MDGTLFLDHGKTLLDLSAVNEEAMAEMKGQIDLYVASGRMIPYGVKVLEKYGFEDIIVGGLNGAVVYDNGSLHVQAITADMVLKACDLADKEFCFANWFLQTAQDKRIFNIVDEKSTHRFRAEMQELGIGEVPYYSIREFIEHMDGDEPVKMTFPTGDVDTAHKLMRRLQEELGDINVTLSSKDVVEFGNAAATKGTFVAYIREVKGYGKDEVAVIGDALNDAPLFDEADHTFAIRSGSDDLKKMAAHVVDDVASCIRWCMEYNQGER